MSHLIKVLFFCLNKRPMEVWTSKFILLVKLLCDIIMCESIQKSKNSK